LLDVASLSAVQKKSVLSENPQSIEKTRGRIISNIILLFSEINQSMSLVTFVNS